MRESVKVLDSVRQLVAVAYGYDANYLPHDFKKEISHWGERFQTRHERAKEVSKWNAENRKFLTEKWNALVNARLSGDTSSTMKIGQEIENFFEGDFKRQHDEANAYFY